LTHHQAQLPQIRDPRFPIGFRVLQSDLDFAPVFHRLPDRIRAHALNCVLALVP